MLTNIQPFPPHSPTHRTCFEADSNEVATVVNRISCSNRIRSIETKYDNDYPIANCIASSNTKYRIQLYYKSVKSSPSNTNIILIEVHRRSGCSLVFNQEYNAIVHAAKYGEIVAPDTSIDGMATVKNSMISKTIPAISIEDSLLDKSLENAQSELLSKEYDIRLSGLEDVASNTNSHLSSENIALMASKRIMMDGKYSGIHESVSSIILKNIDNDFFADSKYIRSLALTILANILSALSRENILAGLIQDGQWCTLSLIPSLIEDIKTASNHQNNASIAAKCISLLLKNSLDAQSKVDIETLVALENAKCVGELLHSRLEKEAQNAINEMRMEK